MSDGWPAVLGYFLSMYVVVMTIVESCRGDVKELVESTGGREKNIVRGSWRKRKKSKALKPVEEPLLREMNRINNSTRETIRSRIKKALKLKSRVHFQYHESALTGFALRVATSKAPLP